MTTKYIQPGEVLDWTNGSGSEKATGVMVAIGKRVGVCQVTIANTATGAVAMTGVFNYTKLGTDVVGVGDLLYFDAGNNRLTTTASTHNLAGYAFSGAGSGATTVNVKLNA
jgi:predicted RecA/RadA family phage recombinase